MKIYFCGQSVFNVGLTRNTKTKQNWDNDKVQVMHTQNQTNTYLCYLLFLSAYDHKSYTLVL